MSAFCRITELNFEEKVLHSKIPVLVDFGAEWCQPCRRLEPLLEKLAVQLSDQLEIVKVDIDQCTNLIVQLQVMCVPTLVLFVGGSECLRLTGLQSQDKIIEKVSPYLSNN